jgi:hypothetical protein
MLKGYTHDFTPLKEIFHVISEEGKGEERISEVKTADLKAIFFVKSLEGNKAYAEKKQFDEVGNPPLGGLKIKVRFADGEVISGTSHGYGAERKGFFITPVDPRSNNERVFAFTHAIKEVKVGSAAMEQQTA